MATSIMVIGGAGYIGTELVCSLASQQDLHITVVDPCWFGNCLPHNIELRKIDAWSLTATDLEGFEAVVFLAGLANDQMCELSLTENFTDNAALPSYLGYISKQSGVSRFIFASSCAVYGDVAEWDAVETDEPNTTHPYGIAKAQAEIALMSLIGEKFHVYCLRKGTVCGWSLRMRLDLVLNTMTRDALMHQCIVVRGPGIWRPIIGVKDLVCVYSSLVLPGGSVRIPSGIYNVAEGNYSVESLAQTVTEVFRRHGRSIRIEVEAAQNKRTCRMDVSRSRAVLGAMPKQTPEEIVTELYHHMYAHDVAVFSEPRFYNVQVFRNLLERRKMNAKMEDQALLCER